LDHEPVVSVDRMGIEPIAPTLQESVAPLEHASPHYSLSAFALGLDPSSSVGGLD